MKRVGARMREMGCGIEGCKDDLNYTAWILGYLEISQDVPVRVQEYFYHGIPGTIPGCP